VWLVASFYFETRGISEEAFGGMDDWDMCADIQKLIYIYILALKGIPNRYSGDPHPSFQLAPTLLGLAPVFLGFGLSVTGHVSRARASSSLALPASYTYTSAPTPAHGNTHMRSQWARR